jgi:hypothetical protein
MNKNTKRAAIWMAIGCGTAVAAWAATTMPSDPASAPLQTISLPAATQPTQNTSPQNGNQQYGNGNQQNGRFQRQGQGQNQLQNQRGNRRRGFNGAYGNDSTMPSDLIEVPPTMDMPMAYDAVSGRNIFIKGRQILQTNQNPGDAGPNPAFQPHVLVFDGATKTDTAMLAYVEDTNTSEVREFKTGDTVTDGKITAITLDYIDYQVGTQTRHILVGQDLSGQNAWNAVWGVGPAGGPGPAGATNAAGVAPGPLPAGDDILSQMKRRRMMEMQQISGGGAAPAGAAGSATPPSTFGGATTAPSAPK